MKTVIYWFFLKTQQFEKAQHYASALTEQGYGLAGGVAGWRVYRMFPKAEWEAMRAEIAEREREQ